MQLNVYNDITFLHAQKNTVLLSSLFLLNVWGFGMQIRRLLWTGNNISHVILPCRSCIVQYGMFSGLLWGCGLPAGIQQSCQLSLLHKHSWIITTFNYSSVRT